MIRVVFVSILCLVTLVPFAQLEEAHMKAELTAHRARFDTRQFKRTGQKYDLIYHHLKMDIDPGVRYVSGSVVTRLVAEEDNFTLFSLDLDNTMTVDSVTSDLAISYSHLGDEIQISVPSQSKGDILEVEIHYQGDPTQHEEKAFGYFFQPDGPVAWSLSQPYGAIGWWPCKQQLYDKIDSIDISLTVPYGNIGASLGLLTGIDTLADSTQTYYWKHRYPVATYLVAVTVSNFYEENHYIPLSNGDSVYHVDYLYPAYKPQADTLRWNINGMMWAFDSLFGEYPFIKEKYGHVQYGRGGGMEHQTLSSMSNLDYNLMAHELGHMWFGDKVTCATWQDLWLNEGWATYTVSIAHEFARTRESFFNYIRDVQNNALEAEEGSVFAYDTAQRGILFTGNLRYAKGAAVLHQLRWEVGDKAFFEGSRAFLADAELCYGFAHTIDFQEAIEKASGKDLTGFFDRYIYNEGHPILTMGWSRHSNKSIKIQLLQETSHPSVSFYPLPIEFRALGEGKDSLFRIEHQTNGEEIVIDLGFKVDELIYDPNSWLLARALLAEGTHSDLSNVTIYPNPATSELSVYLQDKKIDALEVTDLQGRVIITEDTQELLNSTSKINIANMVPGLYFLSISSADETAVVRFTKE